MVTWTQDAIQRRLEGPQGYQPLGEAAVQQVSTLQDPRGPVGTLSRGTNIYNSTSNAANTGSQHPQTWQGLQQYPGQQPAPNILQQFNPRHEDQQGYWNTPLPQQPEFGWTFQPQYSMGMRDTYEQQAIAQAQYQQALNQLQNQFARGQRNLGQSVEEAYNANDVNMADQGILRSGINVGQQADIGRKYLQGMEDIGTSFGEGRNQLELGLADQMRQLESQRRRLEWGRTEEERRLRAEEAHRAAQNWSQGEWNRLQGDINQRQRQAQAAQQAFARLGVATDAAGNRFIVDKATKQTYALPTGGHFGEGAYNAAQVLYGPSMPLEGGYRPAGTYWDYLQQQGIDPPDYIEQVASGNARDPFTGMYFYNPRRIETSRGRVFNPVNYYESDPSGAQPQNFTTENLGPLLRRANEMRAAKGQTPITAEQLATVLKYGLARAGQPRVG